MEFSDVIRLRVCPPLMTPHLVTARDSKCAAPPTFARPWGGGYNELLFERGWFWGGPIYPDVVWFWTWIKRTHMLGCSAPMRPRTCSALLLTGGAMRGVATHLRASYLPCAVAVPRRVRHARALADTCLHLHRLCAHVRVPHPCAHPTSPPSSLCPGCPSTCTKC